MPPWTAVKVDMIAGNSTDGLASVRDVIILRDDRHYFPPYDCAVVVREDALARFPGLGSALEELSGKFTVAAMQKLNYAVDGRHRSAVVVAQEFLRTVGTGSFGFGTSSTGVQAANGPSLK